MEVFTWRVIDAKLTMMGKRGRQWYLISVATPNHGKGKNDGSTGFGVCCCLPFLSAYILGRINNNNCLEKVDAATILYHAALKVLLGKSMI